MENTSMATAPIATTAPKKRKPQGPRIVKPKVMYVAVKGAVDELKVMDDAEDVLALHENEPGVWKVKRHVIPVKSKPKATEAGTVA